jgi:hypothetical protein
VISNFKEEPKKLFINLLLTNNDKKYLTKENNRKTKVVIANHKRPWEKKIQDFFQEEPVRVINPHCPRSHAKSMMKGKRKVVVEELITFEKPKRKCLASKAKKVQKMLH